MKSILYSIPDKYFPGVKVTVPFRAKVFYDLEAGKVVLHDIQMSFKCLMFIRNTTALQMEIEQDIKFAEGGRELVNEMADYVFGSIKTV